jgi:hypothetical protein
MYSAYLQLTEEEMGPKGIDISKDLPIRIIKDILPAISEKHAEKHPSISNETCKVQVNGVPKDVIIPDTIYHGTNVDIKADEVGEKDAEGMYHSKDGMGYFSFEKAVAQSYAERQEKEGEKAKVLERKLAPEDGFLCIHDTHGGIPFMYQDTLYQLSKTGNFRYLLCEAWQRTDVIDIKNFADFVDDRDAKVQENLRRMGLRLPRLGEPYDTYLKDLDKTKDDKGKDGDKDEI